MVLDLRMKIDNSKTNYMSKVKVKLEMTTCVKCGGDMPVLRKVKYGYNSCVNCYLPTWWISN